MKASERPDHLKMLDDLIYQYFEKLRDDEEKSVTLGDLMKMIDLKHKLAPTGSNTGEFWRMLEKIRRDTLSKGGKAGNDESPKKSRSVRKKAK